MVKFIKKTLKNDKGAMDTIIVTLLLVMVGVGLVFGLNTWSKNQLNTVQTATGNKINSVTANVNG